MIQTVFTLFSVVFIVWVVFGPAFNDAEGDKKKKKNGDGGGGFLWALLFAPFILIGWLFFGLGQVLMLIIEAIAALWENLTPLFRKLFEAIGKILELLWKSLKGILRNLKPALRGLFNALRYAIKTLWNAINGILRTVTGIIRSILSFIGDLIRDFPGVLRTFKNIFNAFGKLVKFIRDLLKNLFKIGWLPFAGILAFADLGRKNDDESNNRRKANAHGKHSAKKEERERNGPDATDLLTALIPVPAIVAGTRQKKEQRNRLAAADPLKKGIVMKKKTNGSDPHVMARLQSIGWETRRKMGKA